MNQNDFSLHYIDCDLDQALSLDKFINNYQIYQGQINYPFIGTSSLFQS